jgi:hypothetical protein
MIITSGDSIAWMWSLELPMGKNHENHHKYIHFAEEDGNSKSWSNMSECIDEAGLELRLSTFLTSFCHHLLQRSSQVCMGSCEWSWLAWYDSGLMRTNPVWSPSEKTFYQPEHCHPKSEKRFLVLWFMLFLSLEYDSWPFWHEVIKTEPKSTESSL